MLYVQHGWSRNCNGDLHWSSGVAHFARLAAMLHHEMLDDSGCACQLEEHCRCCPASIQHVASHVQAGL